MLHNIFLYIFHSLKFSKVSVYYFYNQKDIYFLSLDFWSNSDPDLYADCHLRLFVISSKLTSLTLDF